MLLLRQRQDCQTPRQQSSQGSVNAINSQVLNLWKLLDRSQRRRLLVDLHTRAFQHHVLVPSYAVLPDPIIILLNFCDLSIVIDINHHADMAHKALAIRLHYELAIGTDDVVGTSALPDLLKDCSVACGVDVLLRVSTKRYENYSIWSWS